MAKSCAYCGEQATTRDHVPPKCIFLEPRPTDTVTVACCEKCNAGFSGLDEQFRNYLGLRSGGVDASAEGFWKARALPGILKNKRAQREYLSQMREVEIVDPASNKSVEAHAILWPANLHDPMVDRITRGLYFHHFDKPLGLNIPIKVRYHNDDLRDELLKTPGAEKHSIGGEQFSYSVVRAPEAPTISLWTFSFHNTHWASAQTDPEALVSLKNQAAV